MSSLSSSFCKWVKRLFVNFKFSCLLCVPAQVVKLKSQLEEMEAELYRWRRGEKVEAQEQVAVEMERSMVESKALPRYTCIRFMKVRHYHATCVYGL